MWLRLRNVKKKTMFVLSSSLRIPDLYLPFESSRPPFLLLGHPRLLINLSRHWLSHYHTLRSSRSQPQGWWTRLCVERKQKRISASNDTVGHQGNTKIQRSQKTQAVEWRMTAAHSICQEITTEGSLWNSSRTDWVTGRTSYNFGATLGTQLIKNPPANAGSLCREDLLEKEMATHLSEEFYGYRSLAVYSSRVEALRLMYLELVF